MGVHSYAPTCKEGKCVAFTSLSSHLHIQSPFSSIPGTSSICEEDFSLWKLRNRQKISMRAVSVSKLPRVPPSHLASLFLSQQVMDWYVRKKRRIHNLKAQSNWN